MPAWFVSTAVAIVGFLALTAAFFFTVTRGALLVRGALPRARRAADHVYPIYSNMRLIRMVDFQPIIAAILLFQYDRLVSMITHAMGRMDLQGEQVLITSCAFGNVMPRVVQAAEAGGARRVQVVDIIQNELDHAQRKLMPHDSRMQYLRADAVPPGFPTPPFRPTSCSSCCTNCRTS